MFLSSMQRMLSLKSWQSSTKKQQRSNPGRKVRYSREDQNSDKRIRTSLFKSFSKRRVEEKKHKKKKNKKKTIGQEIQMSNERQKINPKSWMDLMNVKNC